ncbi:SDR family oxidoreductase [Gaopeijia maritima]|uniref:SDR family oxidoreductase n=1 Tax=Gaopeijia maritima TaxID=3119007 RepID=A0ABU9EAQ7_9BACT
MSIPLEGRTVLVTGGSRGIGRAVVEAAAEAGAFVHVLSRDPEPVAEVARRSGGAVWPADLGDDAAVWSALDRLRETLGREPWAVVNAAGAFGVSSLADTSVTTFDRMVAINLRGTFLVIRALLPGLLERGSGRIVNVGSVAGRRAFPGNAAYGASKFGVRGLHEVLLEELRGSGVTATLIEPAATDTPLWDPLDPDADPALPARADMLEAGDVADAVLFALTRPEGVRIPLLQIERG